MLGIILGYRKKPKVRKEAWFLTVPHDHMVTYFNLKQLAGADKVASDFDVGFQWFGSPARQKCHPERGCEEPKPIRGIGCGTFDILFVPCPIFTTAATLP